MTQPPDQDKFLLLIPGEHANPKCRFSLESPAAIGLPWSTLAALDGRHPQPWRRLDDRVTD
jgi:hypothetical protein